MRTENSRSECTCWRLDLTNEPGRPLKDDQSIRATMLSGKWLLKKAVACSSWEKMASKNPSWVCAAGVSERGFFRFHKSKTLSSVRWRHGHFRPAASFQPRKCRMPKSPVFSGAFGSDNPHTGQTWRGLASIRPYV